MPRKKGCPVGYSYNKTLSHCIKEKLSTGSKIVDGVIGWRLKNDIKKAVKMLDQGKKNLKEFDTATRIIAKQFGLTTNEVRSWYKEKII